VNVHESYERCLDRTLPESMSTVAPETASGALAATHAPTISKASTAPPELARPTVKWVRPTEVPALIGAR
jgi:hypothetical protein